MGLFLQRGKKLSPWGILTIMARAKKGERVADLAEEFGINRGTINRWLAKWGHETALVDQVKVGRLAMLAVDEQWPGGPKSATG